jgi:hypothetical protein
LLLPKVDLKGARPVETVAHLEQSPHSGVSRFCPQVCGQMARKIRPVVATFCQQVYGQMNPKIRLVVAMFCPQVYGQMTREILLAVATFYQKSCPTVGLNLLYAADPMAFQRTLYYVGNLSEPDLHHRHFLRHLSVL